MILSDRQELQLQKTYDKILYFYPAGNRTYTFLAHRKFGKEVFVHCNHNGKILFQHVFDDPTHSLALISETEAIILLTRKNQILLINLANYQLSELHFPFLFQGSDQSSIQTFNISRMFCVRQKGLLGDNRLKLSYFSYPLRRQNKPVVIYQSIEDEWSHDYIVKKGNEKSLMLWWKSRQVSEYEIRAFRLSPQNNYKGQYLLFTANSNDIGANLKRQLAIGKCWELREEKLLLTCLLQYKQNFKAEEKTQAQMVLDNRRHLLRYLKFKQPPQVDEFQIDQMNMGIFSMIRTFNFQSGQSQPSPVFYINNYTEELLAQQSWECSYLHKQFIPGYQRDTLINCEFDNSDISEIVVTKVKLVNSRMVALHMLLEMHKDFDQDLLKQAVEYLPLYGRHQQ